MNLPEELQQQLHYPPLQTIDANTGLPQDENNFDALGQSAIVTFLAGLYKAVQTKQSAITVEKSAAPSELIAAIFDGNNDVANTIAAYAHKPTDIAKAKLYEVAEGFISYFNAKSENTVIENISTENTSLQKLVGTQRNDILKYVPGGLKIGDLLNDDTLEDDTNKMQGPISTLMHKIENAFSTPDEKENT